jgi:hypothetical protein
MLNADPNEAATASVDTGFDTTPVAATVSPALAPAPGTVDTGFDDPGVQLRRSSRQRQGRTQWLERASPRTRTPIWTPA